MNQDIAVDQRHAQTSITGFYPWLVFGLGASFVFLHYIPRVAPGVMIDELMTAFHVGAFSLGSLSAFFYYPYVGMQIPVGMIYDRFGIRYYMAAMIFVAGVSCFLFGSAQTLVVADFSRFCIGFASAFAFVGTMKLATNWFPPSRIGLLAGLTQAGGMLGAVGGEGPVASAVETFGWRYSMFGMAAMLFTLAVLVLIFVRDSPKQQTQQQASQEKPLPLMTGLRMVLSNSQSWLNAAYIGLLFAPTAAFGELWGPSFLTTVYGMSKHSAAMAVGMIFLGLGLGAPVCGWLSDKFLRRRPLMLLSALASGLFISIVVFSSHLSSLQLNIVLFLFGLSNTGVVVSYALSMEINSHKVSATSVAFANMASVIVGAMFQPVIGFLLDLFADGRIINNLPVYTQLDYQKAMIILPLSSVLAVIFGLFVRETYCSNVADAAE